MIKKETAKSCLFRNKINSWLSYILIMINQTYLTFIMYYETHVKYRLNTFMM